MIESGLKNAKIEIMLLLYEILGITFFKKKWRE
jgi:hypothetical protein